MRVGIPNAEQYLGDTAHIGADLEAICARINKVFPKQHTPDGVHRPSPVCVARHSTTQSLSDSTWTAVEVNTDTIDTHDLHNTGLSSTAVFQITEAGLYVCLASIWFAANATGYRRVKWTTEDGQTLIGQEGRAIGSATAAVTAIAFGVARFARNDRIQVQAWQNSGGSLNIGSTTTEERNQAIVIRIPWAV